MKRPSFMWTCLTILTLVLTGCDPKVKSPPATTDTAGSPQDTAAAEPSAEPTYKVLSPSGESTVKTTAMDARLDTLAGKTVCLVWNRSFKADVTLAAIGEALKKQYPGVKIVPYSAMPVAPLPEPAGAPRKESEALQAAFKAKGCDAVIVGNGG